MKTQTTEFDDGPLVALSDADCELETLAAKISNLKWVFEGLDEEVPNVDEANTRLRVTAGIFFDIIASEVAALSDEVHKSRVEATASLKSHLTAKSA